MLRETRPKKHVMPEFKILYKENTFQYPGAPGTCVRPENVKASIT